MFGKIFFAFKISLMIKISLKYNRLPHAIIYKIVVRQVRELLSKGYKYIYLEIGETKNKKFITRVRNYVFFSFLLEG